MRENASRGAFFLAGMAYNRRHREDPTFPRWQFLLFPTSSGPPDRISL